MALHWNYRNPLHYVAMTTHSRYQSHSNTSFLHMTQETSHCIYSTLPFRFHILDVLSKQYPE